jgi:site-specific recombinase XerC
MAGRFTALRAPTVRKEKRRLRTGELETRWCVTSYDHARKRRRSFFNSRPEAEAAARITQNQQLNEGINASTVAPGLREEAIACEKLLNGTGLTLRQAIELGMKHRPRDTDKTVAEILEEFLKNRKDVRGNRQRTIDEYRGQLGKFAKAFGSRLVDTITAHEIEKWLTKPHTDYRGKAHSWGAKRRNVTRDYISTLFTFAVKRKWCKTNPAEPVDKAIVEAAPIVVWTPAEAESILRIAARDCPDILDFLFLAMFSGARTCELLLLYSNSIKLEQSVISIPANISKTRKLRNIPISANLKAWLQHSRFKATPGRICDMGESSLHRRYRIIEKGTGFLWKRNALRHSFASYHLAMHDNEWLTARACGHSPKMLRDHYDAVVAKPDAEIYWNILPTQEVILHLLKKAA